MWRLTAKDWGHARARQREYAEARVAEMQNIAETVEDVARAKLMCDNIKWETARVAPKNTATKFRTSIQARMADQ